MAGPLTAENGYYAIRTEDERMGFTVRPAESAEEARKVLFPLISKLGWNRNERDALTHFIAAGPSGFLILIPKSSGQPEGCLVPFVFSNNTGWVGFFCIHEGSRGKGWGRALFHAALAHFIINGVNMVGLDAVEEQRKTYERRGFVATGLVRVMTRQSLHKARLEKTIANTHGEKLVNLLEISHDALIESDFAHTGLQRSRLWSKAAMFSRPDVFGYAIVSTVGQDLLGWVLVRECENGYRIGPLYAESASRASRLLMEAMLNARGDGDLCAEVWVQNQEGVKVFEELGWSAVLDYHRMWLGGRIPETERPGGRAERNKFAIFDAAGG